MNANITCDVLERYGTKQFSELMYVMGPVNGSHFGLKLHSLSTGIGGVLVAYQLLRPVNEHFRRKWGQTRMYKSMHSLKGRDVFVYVGVKR